LVRHEIEAGGYSVTVQPGILRNVGEITQRVAPAHRYAIVSDETVAGLYSPTVLSQFAPGSARLFAFAGGETEKTRETWAAITDAMLVAGFGRDTTVIALGGGVVGDMAGFVAATYMRGVPVVQIPTTLLAMIDASIGGKTGVDTPAGKNLVGAFHPPVTVLADPQTLASLPLRELRAGFAEAVKHGVIADEGYFSSLVGGLPGVRDGRLERADAATEMIVRSVSIKAEIVRRDRFEKGVRKVLNFGHTVGHAIELLSGFSLLHGEAIAAGMVVEARAGERAGITEPGTSERLKEVFERVALPSSPPPGMNPEEMLNAMRSDKKGRAGSIEYAIPLRIGQMAGEDSAWGTPLDDTLVRNVLLEAVG
jgi:3-dehydroquinate synthase